MAPALAPLNSFLQLKMVSALNYLFYCFYCLTSAKNFDRVGAARAGLFLLCTFLLMDVYSFYIGMTGSQASFFVGVIVAGFVARLLLVYCYFRPRHYDSLVIAYQEKGEPARVRYALTGAVLLFGSLFLPFWFLRAGG
jgi:hypothetical protein